MAWLYLHILHCFITSFLQYPLDKLEFPFENRRLDAYDEINDISLLVGTFNPDFRFGGNNAVALEIAQRVALVLQALFVYDVCLRPWPDEGGFPGWGRKII